MAVQYNPRIVNTGLIYHFDVASIKSYSGSGSVFYDSVSQFGGGTLENGAVYSRQFGGSVSFDGVNDSVITPVRAETYVPALSSWTMACWIRVTNFPTGGVTNREGMVFGSAYYSGTGIYFSCTPAGDFRVRGYIRGEDQQRITSNYSLVLNQVHYLAIVNDRSNTTFKLYIDGVLKESITSASQQYSPGLAIPPNFENIRINRNMIDGGGEQTYTYFQGNAYQASIYSRALSADELSQNHKAMLGRFNA